jgi:hypothetical protein
MNAKIKNYTPWINVGLIILILFLLEYLLTSVYNFSIYNSWIFSLLVSMALPGAEILKFVTIESINWFGGDQISFYEFFESASVILIGMVVLFILAPWFFLRGRLKANTDDQNYPLSWYISTIILCFGIILPTIFGITQIASNSIERSNIQRMEDSRTLDRLRSYMSHVAFDASEWWILPEEADGGDGTFRPKNRENFTLDMLSSYQADHANFELTLDSEPTDSTVTIVGTVIDRATEDDSEFQISLEVTPYDDSLFKFLNNPLVNN